MKMFGMRNYEKNIAVEDNIDLLILCKFQKNYYARIP